MESQTVKLPSATSFKKWYAKKAKKLNESRRSRYHTDPAYRKKQLKASKNWRKNNPGYRQEKTGDAPKLKTIGVVAEELGTCIQTIRAVEKRGLIPEPNRKGAGHRKYTDNQIALMQPLLDYLRTTHYKAPGYEKEVKRLSSILKKNWKK